MGLSMEQEYELLLMTKESERLAYILGHLKATMTVLREVDRTKKKIELNGHFKNFDPLDFKGIDWELVVGSCGCSMQLKKAAKTK